MHRFHDKIYRTLTDFRQSFNHKWPKCLREDFPFDQLKISRTQLKSFSDLALYELAMFLSKLIKSHIEKLILTTSHFSIIQQHHLRFYPI